MKKQNRIILAVVIGTVLTALSYYVMLPPINVFSTGFWTYLVLVLCFFGVPLGAIGGFSLTPKGNGANSKGKPKINKIFAIAVAIPVAVLVLGHIISSTFFNTPAE